MDVVFNDITSPWISHHLLKNDEKDPISCRFLRNEQERSFHPLFLISYQKRKLSRKVLSFSFLIGFSITDEKYPFSSVEQTTWKVSRVVVIIIVKVQVHDQICLVEVGNIYTYIDMFFMQIPLSESLAKFGISTHNLQPQYYKL